GFIRPKRRQYVGIEPIKQLAHGIEETATTLAQQQSMTVAKAKLQLEQHIPVPQ
ncbi:hypothetical protein A2U01_0019500, partial [Trifolium medium]|nr:hypothetical protein [Trifolium medium]